MKMSKNRIEINRNKSLHRLCHLLARWVNYLISLCFSFAFIRWGQ